MKNHPDLAILKKTTPMRTIILTLIAASTTAVALAQPVDGVDWLDNYQQALDQAKATGKPIFLEYRCEP